MDGSPLKPPLPQPTPAEPRIESVPDERAQAQNDWNKLLLEIARLYALIDDEWADADIGEMDEFDPWYALRELTKRMVGAQAEPDEREAQAEAVNKIWNQFRSGDGEEDCELYRALEQAYGAGRASPPSSPGAAQNVQLLEIIPCAVCGQGQHVGYGHMYVPSEVDK